MTAQKQKKATKVYSDVSNSTHLKSPVNIMTCLNNPKGLRELSFFTGGGGHLVVGGPEFFGMVKGGTSFPNTKGGTRFFPRKQRGRPKFFTYAKGGPEKNGDWPN